MIKLRNIWILVMLVGAALIAVHSQELTLEVNDSDHQVHLQELIDNVNPSAEQANILRP